MNNIKNIIEATLVPHTAFEEATRRLEQCFHYACQTSEPICIALIGESRTGKSRALEECFFKHPKGRDSNGLTVPILRVKAPSKPTVKGLAELMLRALEDPIFGSGTENAKTIRLQKLIRETGTVMVMIDEFQHFFDKGSRKIMHHVADWLKGLVDDCQVALVVAGLPTCRAVLDQNEQLAGRFLSPVIMPRFDWHIDVHREEFIAILASFQESIAAEFDMPPLNGNEMAFRCYCGTGGLIGYLTKFLRQAVWNALDANTQTIGLEDLLRAHDESVWTKDGLLSLPSPFSKGFAANQPTDDLMARVMTIGVPIEPIPSPQHSGARSAAQATRGVQSIFKG